MFLDGIPRPHRKTGADQEHVYRSVGVGIIGGGVSGGLEIIDFDKPGLFEEFAEEVNVKNGLLRIAGRKLLPHSPDHLSPVQLPVKYDPSATCPATDKFDSEVFPADAIDLAREIPGWLMVPHTSIQMGRHQV